MRPRRHRRALLLVLALALLPWSALAAAAPATPATPTGCDVPPRAPEEIARLAAMPMPAQHDRPGVPPFGEPLRPEDQVRIEQTVHRFIACHNAGDPLRISSLLTDRFLQRLLSGEGIDALTTPMPAASGNGAELVGITGGRRMIDIEGRLGAMVTIAFPAMPEPTTSFFIFLPVGDGDRLLIDDVLAEPAAART